MRQRAEQDLVRHLRVRHRFREPLHRRRVLPSPAPTERGEGCVGCACVCVCVRPSISQPALSLSHFRRVVALGVAYQYGMLFM